MLKNKRVTKILAIVAAACLLLTAVIGLSVYVVRQNVMGANAVEIGTSKGTESTSQNKLVVTQPAGVTISVSEKDGMSLEALLGVPDRLFTSKIKGTGVNYIKKTSETQYELHLDQNVADEEQFITLYFTLSDSVQSIAFTVTSGGSLQQYASSIDIWWDTWTDLTLNATVAGAKHTVSFNAGSGYTVSTVENAQGDSPTLLTKASWTVENGNTTYFTVKPKDDSKTVSVLNGTVLLTANEQKVYEIRNITEDIQLTIELADKAVAVTYSYEGEGETNVTKLFTPTTATYGNAFTFRIAPKSGYEISVTASNGQSVEVHQEGSTFTIAADAVKGDTITVTVLVSKKSYHVTYNYNNDAVTLETAPDTASYDATFTVQVKLNAGYKWNSISAATTTGNILKINGSAPSAGGEATTFTITENTITENFTVTISTSIGTYDVIAPVAPQNFTFKGASKATYNTPYSFDITPQEGFDITSVSAQIGERELTVTGANGSYSISGDQITGNITITASVDKITYTITLTSSNGFTYTDEGGDEISELEVKHGESGEFKLKAENGYDLSAAVVRFAGQTIKNEEGKYTLTDVKENGSVIVTGVKMFSYSVSLNGADGFAISSNNANTNLTWGQTYEFSIAVATGYDPTKYSVSLTSGDQALQNSPQEMDSYYTMAKGTYTVTVRSNITVTVTVTDEGGHDGKLNYEVADNAEEEAVGYTLTIVGQDHFYGENVNFTVTAQDGYEVTAVLVNGAPAVQAGSQYVIEAISKNCKISVETREYVLTIVWQDDAHGVNETVEKKYTEIAREENRTLTSETYYIGNWKFGDEEVSSVSELQRKVAKSDASITVTAVWTFNETAIKEFVNFSASFKSGSADGQTGTKVDLVVDLSTDSNSDKSAEWEQLFQENKFHGASVVVGFVVASLQSNGYGNLETAQTSWTGDAANQLKQQLGTAGIFGQNTLTLLGGQDGLQIVPNSLYAYGIAYSGADFCNYHFTSNGSKIQKRAIAFYVAVSFGGTTYLCQSEMKTVEEVVADTASVMEAVLPESLPTFETDEEPAIE